jgi:hypothetical protein
MYRINEVSQRVRLSQKRIREYEKAGFLQPDREPNTNNRRYSDFEVLRIQRINHLIHEQGFTLACLGRMMRLTPCWRIFGCANPEECPAYQQPHRPCWETKGLVSGNGQGPCRKCAVWLNRHQGSDPILPKDPDPASPDVLPA